MTKCKFKVGDRVKRIAYLDPEHKVTSGEVVTVDCFEYEDDIWYLSFEEYNSCEFDENYYELVK